VSEYFAHLIPEKSLVIHQDFYHPTAFYLPVVMDFLSDHFTIVEAGRDWSVVFRLESAIPREKLASATSYKFSFIQQRAALRRMMRRVGKPGCDYLRLSECAAIGTAFGEQRFQTALAAARRQTNRGKDPVWSDGLAWCSDFKASRIRSRLYGSPALMPRPTIADRVYIQFSTILSAVAGFIRPSLPRNRPS
jgi:hypothetical protein